MNASNMLRYLDCADVQRVRSLTGDIHEPKAKRSYCGINYLEWLYCESDRPEG